RKQTGVPRQTGDALCRFCRAGRYHLSRLPASKRFTFEPADMKDAAALAALHLSVAQHLTEQYGDGPWSAQTSEKGVLFAMRHSRVFVAREGTEIIATLRLATKKPWAIDTSYFTPCQKPLYLLAMAVTPLRQRRGIGRKCFDEAARFARREKA